MRRGEIRWYRFRHADKKRPVVVLTRDTALEFLDEVTIAPITSRIRDIPTEVVLGVHDGMQRDCAVNLDHVQTVPRGKLGGLVATLPESRLEEVRRAQLFALGFD